MYIFFLLQLRRGSTNTPFKSPLIKKGDEKEEDEDVGKKITILDEKIAALKKEGHSLGELEEYMKKLHIYNFYKDTAVELMGRLAHIEECTIKDLYKKYNLSVDD